MATFGRSTRQNEIWDELEATRRIVDKGLLSPEDGGYEGDDAEELQEEWDADVAEYAEIHESNDTFG